MTLAMPLRRTAYSKLLTETLPAPIRSDAELRERTAQLLAFDAREDLTPEQQALAELLAVLIEDYESKRYPLPQVSPNASLKRLMEDRGLRHTDVWPVLGNKGATTEILAGRRMISNAQAKRLAEFFKVPVELFL